MIRTIWSFTYLCPSCGDEMVCYAAYLDLVGNARLAFDTVYIERTVADKPRSETRALRSIFTPKAAAILRVLLRDPDRAWRVADLATGLNREGTFGSPAIIASWASPNSVTRRPYAPCEVALRSGSMMTHPGVYSLRSSETDWDEAILWRTYFTLSYLEVVFRSANT